MKLLFIIEQQRYIANVELRQAELESAEANLVKTERDYKRQSSLSKQNYASKATLDTAESSYLQAKAAVAQAKANLDLAKINLGYTEIKETVVVRSVEETGLAAGVLQAGDVLVSAKIRDVVYEIDRNYILTDAMLNARVGDVIEITVERNGERQTVSLTITAESIQAVYTA